MQGRYNPLNEVTLSKFKTSFKDKRFTIQKSFNQKIEKFAEMKLENTLSIDRLKNESSPFLPKSNSQASMSNCEEKEPLLCIDVNLEKGKVDQITYYEGDSSEKLARDFSLNNSRIN